MGAEASARDFGEAGAGAHQLGALHVGRVPHQRLRDVVNPFLVHAEAVRFARLRARGTSGFFSILKSGLLKISLSFLPARTIQTSFSLKNVTRADLSAVPVSSRPRQQA